MNDLAGKTIIITAGSPRENIDGIRHYANHKRLESHGFAAAKKLKERGARVIIVTPQNSLVAPAGCEVVKTLNGKDLLSGEEVMAATENVLKTTRADAVLCLASISSLRAAAVSGHKIKAKSEPGKPITLNAVGNIDIKQRALTWGVPALGYDSSQQPFATANVSGWLSTLDIFDEGEKDWPTSVEGGTDWAEIFEKTNFPEWLTNSLAKEEIKEKKEVLDLQTVKAEVSLSPDFFENLKNKTIVLTSGPTEELLTKSGDVITNFSTGQQGYEIACILAAAGAKVKYIVGRTSFPAPKHKNVEVTHVTSAQSMLEAAESALPADIYIGVAAVADFGRKTQVPPLAETESTSMELDQNPDILERIGTRQKDRPELVIGFAAENDPNKLIDYAIGKLQKKNADMICANLAGEQSGLPKGKNQITFVVLGDSPRRLPVMPKDETGLAIVGKVAVLLARELVY